MARIKTYSQDDKVELTDKVIGTDALTGKTKNYSIQSILELFQSPQANGDIVFKYGNQSNSGEVNSDTKFFTNLSVLYLNKTTSSGTSVILLIDAVKNKLNESAFTIRFQNVNNPELYIITRITDIVDNGTFYTITVITQERLGAGTFEVGKDYSLYINLLASVELPESVMQHIIDEGIHVTSQDKINWNNKSEKISVGSTDLPTGENGVFAENLDLKTLAFNEEHFDVYFNNQDLDQASVVSIKNTFGNKNFREIELFSDSIGTPVSQIVSVINDSAPFSVGNDEFIVFTFHPNESQDIVTFVFKGASGTYGNGATLVQESDFITIGINKDLSSKEDVGVAASLDAQHLIDFDHSLIGQVPTLQQVLTAGDTTDKNIIINSVDSRLKLGASSLQQVSATGGDLFLANYEAGKSIRLSTPTASLDIETNSIAITTNNNVGWERAILKTTGITADRTFTFPNQSGTLAVTTDIPSPQDLSGLVPYTGATQDVNIGFNNLLAGGLSIVKANGINPPLLTASIDSDGVYRSAISLANIDANDILTTKEYVDNKSKSYQTLPTGYISGLVLSINADTTKFNIASGVYSIVDYTDVNNPIVSIKNYAGVSGVTPTYLATANATYIGLDVNGTIIQRSSPFSNEDRRTIAIIGAVIHSNRTTINTTNEIKAPIIAPLNQLHDFIKTIGTINISGNEFSPNGTDLKIQKTSGKVWGLGINASSYLDPHTLTLSAQVPTTFRYRLRTGTEYADTLFINPTQYDASGILTTVSNNKFTIQRINIFQSGLVRVQYGQHLYNSLSEAKAGLPTESFVLEQNIADNAIFRTYLVIKKEVTNLTSALSSGDAEFIPVDKFGGLVGVGGTALTFTTIVNALGFTPENVANKQNSLATDGTGTKYPTVDAITAPNIPAARLGNSTFTSVQHIQDLFHSAGWTSGGVITNAGGGLITVSAGTGLIRAINSDVATIYFTDFPASTPANVVLVDGSQNYIYVEYNDGTPRVIATTIQRADYNTSFLIGAVYRIGTTLHINSTVKTAISDHAGKMIAFNKEVMPYARANGSMISEVATRGFAITAGTFWNGLVRFTTNAFSTATGSFFYFYRNGVGGWTKVPTQTQINNTQFDNGTGALATLSNNKYGIHWVFIDTDGDTYVVYGQGDYTLIEAQNAMIPASLPVEITSHGFVVGKIIIQKSATTFAQIESAFTMGFSSAMASEHNSLAGLDTGNYLHLTEAQKTIAIQEATNILSGYVSAGTQTFGGEKTFTLSPIVPTPTTNTQATNKSYVDGKVTDIITDGVTTIAPSQNAVFDALALKEPANANIQTHISSTSNPHGVTKTQVGLSNVDNTSDLNKPISTATQTALNLKEDKSNKNIANGYAGLDENKKLDPTQLPDLAITKVFTATETTLALFAAASGGYIFEDGDVVIIINGADTKHYIFKGGTKTTVGNYSLLNSSQIDWSQLVSIPTPVTNLSGTNTGDQTSIVGITGTKAQFDTAVTDGNFMYVGDAPTAHNHPPSDITQDASNRFVTDAEKTTWNAKQDALTNPITGTGTTNYLPKFTGTGVIGNSQIFDNGTNVGIGTTATTARFGVQGTTAMDLPTYGSEFLLSTGWTSVGWTGDFATGFTHTTGNTSVLSNDKVAVNATRYQIAYTVTNRTAGSFTVSFGGQSNGGITATGTFGPTATSTANLTITPTSDFNGTIVISIRAITGVSTPIASYLSSDGTVRIEVRVRNASSNTFIGIGAGKYTTTGVSNSFFGKDAGANTTTGVSNSFFGAGAGANTTTGVSNSFFGRDAGLNTTTGVSNSFFGVSAGVNTTTGVSNSFFGVSAGANTTTGGNNSFFGRDAGRFIADGVIGNLTGGNSVFLGEGTRALADAQTNQIVIGQGAIGNGSNTATLGNTSVTRTILRGNVETNGSVKVADDTASASVSKVGAIRYRTTANSSIVEMCMQTGESSYQWQTIVTNTW